MQNWYDDTLPNDTKQTAFALSLGLVTTWYSSVDEAFRQAAFINPEAALFILKARAVL